MEDLSNTVSKLDLLTQGEANTHHALPEHNGQTLTGPPIRPQGKSHCQESVVYTWLSEQKAVKNA